MKNKRTLLNYPTFLSMQRSSYAGVKEVFSAQPSWCTFGARGPRGNGSPIDQPRGALDLLAADRTGGCALEEAVDALWVEDAEAGQPSQLLLRLEFVQADDALLKRAQPRRQSAERGSAGSNEPKKRRADLD